MFDTRNCGWYKEMNEDGEPFRQGQQHTELRELVKRLVLWNLGSLSARAQGHLEQS